jgi:maltooligosyltrehalose trehalohydrolase
MLFQGEEWCSSSPFLYFVDFNDEPGLANAVAEGRCREFASFGWERHEIPDPTSAESFLRSKLIWDELDDTPHADMLYWYQSLIQLRKKLSALTTGRLDLIRAEFDAENEWLSVERAPIHIVCNFSKKNIALPCKSEDKCSILLASRSDCHLEGSDLHLPRESVAIVGPAEFSADQQCLWSPDFEDRLIPDPAWLSR